MIFIILGIIAFVLLVYYIYSRFYWTSLEIWWKKREAKKLYEAIQKLLQ